MQKISSITATATPDGQFTNGSVATGVSPTILDAGWFNTIQNELVNVVLGAGLSLDPQNDAQVLAALKKLFLQRTNPFGDIAADGATAISKGLANLGLGDGSALPVGIPVPWPLATPPAGWLKCNGASFSATDYPKLASVYPSLKLPDLRGEFIRGWDDGRGVDVGRTVGSAQASTGLRTAALDYPGVDSTTNGATIGTAFNQPDSITKTQPSDAKAPDNSVLQPVLSDNSIQATQLQSGLPGNAVWITSRPRNVALNYIVRAA